MTDNEMQDVLNKIWHDCANGWKPGNWAATGHGDIDALRGGDRDQLWVRKTDGVRWVEVP